MNLEPIERVCHLSTQAVIKQVIAILFRRACLAAAFSFGLSPSAAPKHVLVVTAAQGFRHSSIPLAEKVLAGLGEKSHAFTVDYVRGGKDGKDDADVKEKMTPEALKKYDAIIFANTT